MKRVTKFETTDGSLFNTEEKALAYENSLTRNANTLWVLTKEVNDYNQHGEYFICVWTKEPTAEQIADATGYKIGPVIDHILDGGGRISYDHYEESWFNLRPMKAGEKI